MNYVYKALVSILVRFHQVVEQSSDTSHSDHDLIIPIYAMNEYYPIFLIKLVFLFETIFVII